MAEFPKTEKHFPFASDADERIDTLGEVALLTRIREWLGEASPPSPQGIGDDCAVWQQPPAGQQLLFTTDAVVYGRHFDASCPPELAAAKLLKRNLSDIAAMGGTPHSALLALTLPRNLSLCWLQRFYLGLRDCSQGYATPISGGDITEGTDNFFAAHITLIGYVKRPLLRSGARAGDHLFVTGALGGSIHGHHLHFTPRLLEGQWLATQPDVRAMIDLTDGLAKDLPELLPPEAEEAEAASPHVVVRQAHAQRGRATRHGLPAYGGHKEQHREQRREHGEKMGVVPDASESTGEQMASGAIAAQTTSGAIATQTTIALLDLAALPLNHAAQSEQCTGSASMKSTAIESAVTEPTATEAANMEPTATESAAAEAATLEAATLEPATMKSVSVKSVNSDTVSDAIARALFDGEDYELLFAVDGQTDPAEFVARWQRHFDPIEAPAPKASPHTQAAHPPHTQSVCPSDTQAAYPFYIGKIALVPNHPARASRLYDAATGQPLALNGNGFEHLKS